MEEGKNYFLVVSNAGYGSSLRGIYLDNGMANKKAERLHKKGHTEIELQEVTFVAKTQFVPAEG